MSNWIERFPQKKVVILRTTDTIFDAAKAMSENEIGCVVVANSRGHLVGICTDRDLVCRAIVSKKSPRTPLSEVMTKSLVTAEDGATVEEVINLMIQSGVRRIPLVSMDRGEYKRCVGIVSLDDLIANRMADEMQFAEVIISQIKPGINRRTLKRVTAESVRAEAQNRFSSEMAAHMEMPVGMAASLGTIVLGCIMCLLPAEEASALADELPESWKKDVMQLSLDHDKKIAVNDMVHEVASLLDEDEDEARRMVQRFLLGLGEWLRPGVLARFMTMLPSDFQELFTDTLAEDNVFPMISRLGVNRRDSESRI
jgi:CBS domain-containing protein/uncharacterized protein (DUF2267 family)